MAQATLTTVTPVVTVVTAEERAFNAAVLAIQDLYIDRETEWYALGVLLDDLQVQFASKLDGLMLHVTWSQKFRRRLGSSTRTTVVSLVGFETYRFAARHAKKYIPVLDHDDVDEVALRAFVDIVRRLDLGTQKVPSDESAEVPLSALVWPDYSAFRRTTNAICGLKAVDVAKERNRRPRPTPPAELVAADSDDPHFLATLNELAELTANLTPASGKDTPR